MDWRSEDSLKGTYLTPSEDVSGHIWDTAPNTQSDTQPTLKTSNITADFTLTSARELQLGLRPHNVICVGCYAILATSLISLLAFPTTTLTTLTIISAVFGSLIGLFRILACLSAKQHSHSNLTLADKDWPFYTVLVPVYKEEVIIPSLLKALSQIDYPKSRHEIFIICEGDDHPTIRATQQHIEQEHSEHVFKLIQVPPSFPRTKPKALNIAMQQARGEIVTIFDAEDRPHPDQLKHAASALMADPKLAAVQAPLNYFNHGTNWLTRQFALEYAVLFHVWVPFLTRLGWPFPLGGTSNHIRREALDLCRGWDSYNVTEDADLSFRLSALGYKIGYVSPPTDEEAVESWQAWQHQRARWIKGFIQTWLVHMSRPLAPGGVTGLLRFVTIQMTIGSAILAALIHLPFMIWAMGSLILSYMGFNIEPPHHLIWPSLALCYGAGILAGFVAARRLGRPSLIPSLIFIPFYWWLLFPASLQAVYEFLRAPFHWNKTEHGVTGKCNTTP